MDLLLKLNIATEPLYMSKMVITYGREEQMMEIVIQDGPKVVSKHHNPIHRESRDQLCLCGEEGVWSEQGYHGYSACKCDRFGDDSG